MRKTKENTEISKLRILLAAEEEFCQRGYVAANMDAIANTAGLTKGAIFWHYKSKAGLFNATIQRAIDRINKINKEAFSSSLPIMEKCRKMIKQIKKDKSFSILLSLRNETRAFGKYLPIFPVALRKLRNVVSCAPMLIFEIFS